ncbi:MAG: 4Fe-4S dicluster domain-containing protein [Dehalococcoidia bacterium]|jgi:heterodisulfide reductase subunit C
MTIVISKKRRTAGIRPQVEEMSGVKLDTCYQCRKCSAGCPVAGPAGSAPSEIIRRLHLGAGDELLQSGLVWMCLSCETCYGRCPMQINFPAVIDTLRSLSIAKGIKAPKGDMPLFNRMFLQNVKIFGRSYDLSMIMGYKLGSGKIMDDAEKFPAMLGKGKMAILPPSGADKKTVRRIFENTAGVKSKTK